MSDQHLSWAAGLSGQLHRTLVKATCFQKEGCEGCEGLCSLKANFQHLLLLAAVEIQGHGTQNCGIACVSCLQHIKHAEDSKHHATHCPQHEGTGMSHLMPQV